MLNLKSGNDLTFFRHTEKGFPYGNTIISARCLYVDFTEGTLISQLANKDCNL